MKFLISIFFVFSLLANATETRSLDSQFPALGEKEMIYEVRLTMAHGLSTWQDFFTPRGSSPMQIVSVVESTCPRFPYMDVYVRHEDTQLWEKTNYVDKLDHFTSGKIDGIRFYINQPWYLKETCTFRIYAANDPVVQPTEKLAGALKYMGGFKDAGLSLTGNPFITHFRVHVPKFCQDVEVLEAATLSGGAKDMATLVNPTTNLFSVNEGHGLRASDIIVSINGPSGLDCDLPVYITEKN